MWEAKMSYDTGQFLLFAFTCFFLHFANLYVITSETPNPKSCQSFLVRVFAFTVNSFFFSFSINISILILLFVNTCFPFTSQTVISSHLKLLTPWLVSLYSWVFLHSRPTFLSSFPIKLSTLFLLFACTCFPFPSQTTISSHLKLQTPCFVSLSRNVLYIDSQRLLYRFQLTYQHYFFYLPVLRVLPSTTTYFLTSNKLLTPFCFFPVSVLFSPPLQVLFIIST